MPVLVMVPSAKAVGDYGYFISNVYMFECYVIFQRDVLKAYFLYSLLL